MQTVGYLTEDARWKNHREYLIAQYGFVTSGFLFGLLIALVMPVMVCAQNVIRLYVQVLFGVRKESLGHIFYNFATQSVISFESEIGEKIEESQTKKTWKYFLGTIVSYAAYISLPIMVLCCLQFYSSNQVVCRPLKPTTEFLLDSEAELANNLTFLDLYEQRKEYGKSHEKWDDWSGEGGLLWDDYENERKHNYMPLTNISDFIDQFNLVGYHDICNYFDHLQIKRILNPLDRSKGLTKIVPGYGITNGTGKD